MDTKVCPRCGLEKGVAEFYAKKVGEEALSSWCRECSNTYHRAYMKTEAGKQSHNKSKKKWREHPTVRDKYAEYNRKKAYGITLEQYNNLLEKQHGCCAICGSTQDARKYRLAVDHNHATGEIRGLLCNNCNAALGMLQDDSQLVFKAYQYLCLTNHL